MKIPARLLLTRRFAPFFAALLTGAYNDNVLRNALAVLVTYQIASYAGLDSGALVAAAAGVFILPFFLFSATGGALADRYPRHRLVRAVKLAEVLLMALAWLGFAWNSLGLLFAVLFLTGLQSALFGPVKYAILPNLLARGELLGGNAWVAAGTFAAILAGTLTGTLLMAAPDARAWVPGVLLASAGFGYACSRFVPAQAPGHPDLEVSWNPLRETARILRQGLAEPGLPGVMLAISWFWMIGAGVLVQLPVYMRDTLAGNEQALGGVLAVFTIGVALGALLCGALARGRDRIAAEYADGFPVVLGEARPLWRALCRRWGDECWAMTGVFLSLLARYPDSHIARVRGAAAAARISGKIEGLAADFCGAAAPQEHRQRLLDLDACWKSAGISPGTSADLTLCGVFAARLGDGSGRGGVGAPSGGSDSPATTQP